MNLFNGRNVLITGGLGFVGSNLAIKLVELGAKVKIIDMLHPTMGGNFYNIEPVKQRVKVIVGDIFDKKIVKPIIEDTDIIYNLAGQISHIDSMIDPYFDLDINCKSQISLLENCREYNPQALIVFASTRQIYGTPKYLPVNEEHPVIPIDVNGIHKYAAECYHTLYNKYHGLKTVSLRLTNTFGPRQAINLDNQGVLGIFIRKALMGERIKLFGTGCQLRDFNYVDDVVEALLLCGQEKVAIGKTYNLGDNKHHSLLDFVNVLKERCSFAYDIVPFPKDKELIDIGDYYSDITKISKDVGWLPKTNLIDGVGKTIEYFKKHLKHYMK